MGGSLSKRDLVLASLVVANAAPLFGVLLWGWDVGDIMLLFWAESAIIGLFSIIKLALAARWGALFLVPFFTVHFGIFMSVHFVFLYVFFIGTEAGMAGSFPQTILAAFAEVWWAFAVLFLSHAVSFLFYFVDAKERLPVNKLMSAPYARVIVMHVTIIFGAVPTLALGQPVYALVLLILLKIGADVFSHLRAHRARPPASLAGTPPPTAAPKA